MTDTPDRVMAELREEELRQDKAEQRHDRYRKDAEEIVWHKLFRPAGYKAVGEPNIEWLLELLREDLPEAIGGDEDWRRFSNDCAYLKQTGIAHIRAARLKRIGEYIETALERCAEKILESDKGQQLISEEIRDL